MSITLELPESLTSELQRRAAQAGQTPTAFVEEALRRTLALERFEERRRWLVECGRRAGFHTDEDVFAAIS